MTTQPIELPRELLPGLMWLGECAEQPWKGELLHAHNSVFLVSGSKRSVLVDTGLPKDWPALSRQLDAVLGHDVAPVTHLFPTHVEMAHASNLARLAAKFPETVVIGDVRDYHLIFPELESRLVAMDVGEALDLGGTSFVVVEAVIRDVVTSRWGYDTAKRTLFPGDGFAHLHLHKHGECGHTAEEVPDLPFFEMSLLMAEHALYWTRFTDVEPQIARLHELFTAYPVDLIAPGHGLPMTDPATTVPKVEDGLRVRALEPTSAS